MDLTKFLKNDNTYSFKVCLRYGENWKYFARVLEQMA